MIPVQEASRSRPVKAVVAEDEGNLRDELCETLAVLWPELAVCGRAADGIEALRAWEQHAPDILFLDIQMPGISGLEVAKLASGRSHVVFVTAYDRYAVSAFKQGAIDYVLKPFEPARLAETVARLKARVDSAPARLEGLVRALSERLAGGGAYLRWITASQGQELRLITTDEICYFRSDHKYTSVVTAERESLICRPIKELVGMLDPSVFWQIHRGTIVNIRHISGIVRNYRGQLSVKLRQRTETLPVSAPYAHLFKQM